MVYISRDYKKDLSLSRKAIMQTKYKPIKSRIAIKIAIVTSFNIIKGYFWKNFFSLTYDKNI